MERDFLYHNAPLVEVIAELRWALQNIMAPSAVSIDPHFSAFSDDFRGRAVGAGFGFVERVIPETVPLELTPHAAVFRFRPRQNQWPCMQIGPGVLTANHVPPYAGWADFRNHLRHTIDILLETYPSPQRYLNINLLELRYVDAFRERHLMKNPYLFIGEHLQLPHDIADSLLALCEGGVTAIDITSNYSFPLKTLPGSTARIQLGSGNAYNEPAVIVTLSARMQPDRAIDIDAPALCDWFDRAHVAVRAMFESMISLKLKEAMGPKKEIGD